MNLNRKNRIMKIKLIGCVVISVMVAMFLAGCGDQEIETFEKKKVSGVIHKTKTKLNWIGHWLNEHDREVIVRDVAKEFAIKNLDIDLNLKFPQNIRGYRSKRDVAKLYVEMTKTGNYDWDVIWLDDQIYQYVADELKDPYWGPKYLVDFGQLPGFKDTQKGFIFDNPIWAAQTGGIIVGPMLEGYYHAIFFNKDVADKMGIEIKEMGMTFDDLLGYVKAVDNYNKKTETDIAAFYESSDWTCQEILFQRLLKSEIGDFKKSLENKGSAEKNAAFKKTLEAFEKLGKYKPLIKNYQENIWFQTRHIPLNDEVLFYVNGIWMYNHWMSADETKADKMIPAELPVFKEVDFYQGGYIPTWAVWQDAPHKKEGIKLLEFWSRPHVAEKWARYTNAPTGVKGQATTGRESSHPFSVWQKKITEKYSGNIYYIPSTAYIFGKEERNELLLNDVKEEILKLLDGETTAQEAYDRIMTKVK
ncbi:MAG: carbohydrate ABC transporter substrate-binding protein [Desulfobacterales bacterium]|nr:carbohydrate ABC transporter substrate-binding protein [Desulfobacterales bacterium]